MPGIQSGFAMSPALARAAPFALFIALLALEALVGDRLGDARWLTVLRPVLVAGLLAFLWRHYTELHGPARIAPRHLALAIGVGIAVFATWVAFDRGWAAIESTKTGFVPLRPDGRLDLTLTALRLAGLGLVVPLMEELFWRSFLLRWMESPRDFVTLDPRRVGMTPFVLASVLFASEHALWFAGLVAGVSYTLVYLRSRNLWAAILSHAVTNITLGAWILGTHDWRLW